MVTRCLSAGAPTQRQRRSLRVQHTRAAVSAMACAIREAVHRLGRRDARTCSRVRPLVLCAISGRHSTANSVLGVAASLSLPRAPAKRRARHVPAAGPEPVEKSKRATRARRERARRRGERHENNRTDEVAERGMDIHPYGGDECLPLCAHGRTFRPITPPTCTFPWNRIHTNGTAAYRGGQHSRTRPRTHPAHRCACLSVRSAFRYSCRSHAIALPVANDSTRV